MRKRRLLMMAVLAGCTAGASDGAFGLGEPERCIPGEQRGCACPGGAPDGVQICSDAGDRFGVCSACDLDDGDGLGSDDAGSSTDQAGDDTAVATTPSTTDADSSGTAETTEATADAPTDPMPPAPLPDGSAVVEQVALEHPDWLVGSCVDTGGNNEFLFEVVRRLRMSDARWGLNWKRGNIGDMSQDVVDYHWGEGPSEGSTEVYIIDMIGGHCGDDPQPAWIDVTQATADAGTIGMWTLAGQDL